MSFQNKNKSHVTSARVEAVLGAKKKRKITKKRKRKRAIANAVAEDNDKWVTVCGFVQYAYVIFVVKQKWKTEWAIRQKQIPNR